MIFSRGDESGSSFESSVRVYQIIRSYFTWQQLTPHSKNPSWRGDDNSPPQDNYLILFIVIKIYITLLIKVRHWQVSSDGRTKKQTHTHRQMPLNIVPPTAPRSARKCNVNGFCKWGNEMSGWLEPGEFIASHCYSLLKKAPAPRKQSQSSLLSTSMLRIQFTATTVF
jgi:hypothetical protein